MPTYTTKFHTLVTEYVNTAIEFPDLKDITLAQWILESGRGSSDLASLHNNFGGLKWRSEMAGYATPVHYEAHDGPDTYCAFASEKDFIIGYWRFLERPPYKGWRAKAGSDEGFIQFIGKIYAPASDSYDEQVLNLRAEARQLLSAVSSSEDRDEDDGHGTSEPFTKPPIKQFIQSPNRESRDGVKIARVVLHYTAGPSAQSAINTFLKQTGKRTSAHYIVDKNGDIYQMVEDSQKAWHCKGANADTIGIEHVAMPGDALTPAQATSSIALIKWLLSAYKLKADAITGHDFAKGYTAATDCPHSLFGEYKRNDRQANQRTLQAWVQRNFSEFVA
ncbi:MAG: N-acetylmuramoyl-L-alanine amidase [Pseudomonadota bacterium]